MKMPALMGARLQILAQRLNALSLRERGLIFVAGAGLIYIAWHTLLMGPLNARELAAENRLAAARHRLSDLEQMGSLATANPLAAATARNASLESRLSAIDADLRTASQGYVAPDRTSELLRKMLDDQPGLKLVSLKSLPVLNLSQAPAATAATGATGAAASGTGLAPAADGGAAADMGPFLHPVELVVVGDFGSIVAYLRVLEGLPWKIHWQELELTAQDYPANRVRIVIGSLSLSSDWIAV